jgi:hypothetical protein
MFTIIDKTTNTRLDNVERLPFLEEELDRGDDILIIDFKTNHILVPRSNMVEGWKEWDYIRYPFVSLVI